MQKLLWVMPLLALLAALTQSNATHDAREESGLPSTPAIQAYLRQAQQHAALTRPETTERPLFYPACAKPLF